VAQCVKSLEEAVRHYEMPHYTFCFAAESLQRVLMHGGDLQLDDVRFEFHDLPSSFEDMAPPSGEKGTVIVRAPTRTPSPWNARFVAMTDRGDAAVDIRLVSAPAPDDWDAALSGSTAGIGATVLFRKRDDRGQMKVHWQYDDIPTDARTKAQVLALIDALHGVGTLAIEDRDGVRPTANLKLVRRAVDEYLPVLRRFVDDIVVIEDWTGRVFDVPDHTPATEIRAIADAAQIIRAGESRMTFEEFELVVPREKYDEIASPGLFRAELPWGLAVLGEEFMVGVLGGELPGAEIAEVETVVEESGKAVRVCVRPSSEESRHRTFRLSRLPDDKPLTRQRDRFLRG
jgi:hypothetical protein